MLATRLLLAIRLDEPVTDVPVKSATRKGAQFLRLRGSGLRNWPRATRMQLHQPHTRTWNAGLARGWQVNPWLGTTALSGLKQMPQRPSEITSDAFGCRFRMFAVRAAALRTTG